MDMLQILKKQDKQRNMKVKLIVKFVKNRNETFIKTKYIFLSVHIIKI